MQLTVAEPLEREAGVRAHPDRVDHRRDEAPDAGIGQPGTVAVVQIDRGEHPHGT